MPGHPSISLFSEIREFPIVREACEGRDKGGHDSCNTQFAHSRACKTLYEGTPHVMKKLYGLIGKPVEAERKAKWDLFWEYFVSTWCELYELACWNVSGMIDTISRLSIGQIILWRPTTER